MRTFDERKHNILEFLYEILYINYQAYDYGGLSDAQYEKIKREIFDDNSWERRYSKLSRRKFKKYNRKALLALIRLFDAGAITKDEYCRERKKIVIEYKDKNADYYDL